MSHRDALLDVVKALDPVDRLHIATALRRVAENPVRREGTRAGMLLLAEALAVGADGGALPSGRCPEHRLTYCEPCGWV